VRLRFRDCVLDTGVRVLMRKDASVALSPKAFKLLEVLAAERPNAVSHNDLRRRLWPDSVAGGTTLARLISEVRTAIDDRDPGNPMVRTVQRFGYAFAAVAEDMTGPVPLPVFALRWGSQLVPLAPGDHVIGRAPDALITLPSSKVSRRHARISVIDGRAVIEDLGSRNGTYIGKHKVHGAVELKNGDRIGIGPAQFIFCASTDDELTSADSRTKG